MAVFAAMATACAEDVTLSSKGDGRGGGGGGPQTVQLADNSGISRITYCTVYLLCVIVYRASAFYFRALICDSTVKKLIISAFRVPSLSLFGCIGHWLCVALFKYHPPTFPRVYPLFPYRTLGGPSPCLTQTLRF
jgi:hypothetical protein